MKYTRTNGRTVEANNHTVVIASTYSMLALLGIHWGRIDCARVEEELYRSYTCFSSVHRRGNTPYEMVVYDL
jgi:hypothetical protein